MGWGGGGGGGGGQRSADTCTAHSPVTQAGASQLGGLDELQMLMLQLIMLHSNSQPASRPPTHAPVQCSVDVDDDLREPSGGAERGA